MRTLMLVWAKPGSGSRRALELSSRMNWSLEYIFPARQRGRIMKGLLDLVQSLRIVNRHKPDSLVVQVGPGPAALVGLYFSRRWRKPFYLDAHTGVFMQDGGERGFYFILRPAFKRARRVFVHNRENEADARGLGGTPHLLEDPLPRFPEVVAVPTVMVEHPTVFVPCSWSVDEPLDEIVGAARLLPEIRFLVTGRPKWDVKTPENVTLTGLLDPDAYVAYLRKSDVVLALTTREGIMLCSAWEAVSAGRVLVTSATRVLQEKFNDCGIFVGATAQEIATGIRRACSEASEFQRRSVAARSRLESSWGVAESSLKALLSER